MYGKLRVHVTHRKNAPPQTVKCTRGLYIHILCKRKQSSNQSIIRTLVMYSTPRFERIYTQEDFPIFKYSVKISLFPFANQVLSYKSSTYTYTDSLVPRIYAFNIPRKSAILLHTSTRYIFIPRHSCIRTNGDNKIWLKLVAILLSKYRIDLRPYMYNS